MTKRNLSKSKVMAYRQCPKRLWLQVHKPEFKVESALSQTKFSTGNQVGDIAIELYSQNTVGEVIDPFKLGWVEAIARTKTLLDGKQPIFEATFTIDGALAMADVLMVDGRSRTKKWRMVEVKSTTKVKDQHIEDAAFQYYVASNSGLKLSNISLAFIDSAWTYKKQGNYQGLLTETDLTTEAIALQQDVSVWLAGAHKTANKRKEPNVEMGAHCGKPYECEFKDYCGQALQQAEFPVSWFPRPSKKLKQYLEANQIIDMRDTPDEVLNKKQILVKECTLDNEYYLDEEGAQFALSHCQYPLYFLDFETINFAVPKWCNTRPYQQIPFQYSLHKLLKSGKLTHSEFLDLSGDDPRHCFALQLIKECGKRGSILVYNQGFEMSRIKELAHRFPTLSKSLLALNSRVVDLFPICQNYYYHPDQQGSWSIKKVLPNMVPDLSYDKLEGVQHGGAAMDAFVEAIDDETADKRKLEIDEQLRRYCQLDTYAMVKILEYFKSA
jgi:hypothetical protein